MPQVRAAAAVERARRVAEEQRFRAERLDQARAEVGGELDALRQQAVTQTASGAGRYAATDLQALEHELAEMRAAWIPRRTLPR